MNTWFGCFNKRIKKYQMPINVTRNAGWNRRDLNNVSIIYKTQDSFPDDQVFLVTDDRIIIQDGLILNVDELLGEESYSCLKDYIMARSQEVFFDKFMGPFSGMVYYTQDSKMIVYTNQTGDSPVFYYDSEDFFVTSNDFNLIYSFKTNNGLKNTPDEKALLSLMTYGYMIDNRTMISDIKRIDPGQYIIATNSSTIAKTYHRFEFRDINIDQSEAVDKMDLLFRKAVKRCFEKDKRYGASKHLVDMSGGMDSRMTNWVARHLGYTNITNINYCQSGSRELKCASAASASLKNQFLHKQLDDASFLYEIDEIVNMNYGLAIFCGITGGKQLLESLNPRIYGVEHTGQLGDVIIGNYGGSEFHIPIQRSSFKYSSLINFEIPEEIISRHENNEEFGFYCRGFRGILSTSISRRHYYYVVSPFLDPEFMQFCFHIPMRYRNKQKLYWKWVDSKYPEAGQIPTTRERPGNKQVVFLRRVKRKIKRDGIKILGKLNFSEAMHSKNTMNPFEYWWETNEELKSFFIDYYDANICRVSDYPSIEKNVKTLFSSEKIIDKMLAVNVLAIFKRYFKDAHE